MWLLIPSSGVAPCAASPAFSRRCPTTWSPWRQPCSPQRTTAATQSSVMHPWSPPLVSRADGAVVDCRPSRTSPSCCCRPQFRLAAPAPAMSPSCYCGLPCQPASADEG